MFAGRSGRTFSNKKGTTSKEKKSGSFMHHALNARQDSADTLAKCYAAHHHVCHSLLEKQQATTLNVQPDQPS
jgi:hypothetical protein